MAANYDEAMRCVALAAAALREGERARSQRLLAKASRMCPDLDVPDALRKCSASAAPRTAANGVGSAEKSVPAPAPEAEPQREASAEMRADVAAVQRAAQDLYAVLGVRRDAKAAELKRAYRKKVLALHPDKNVAPGAEDAFKAVARAWETLSDPERRHRYDVLGVTDDAPPQPQLRRRRRAHMHHDNPFVHVHTMHGDVEMDELFAAMFGAPPAQRAHFRRRAEQPPQQEVSPVFAMLWVFAVLGTFSFISFVMNILQQLLVG